MAKKDAKQIINDNLNNIEEWTAQGLTMKQIAINLGLSDRTLYRHMSQSGSPLSQSVKKGRTVAVSEIENAMYNSAVGYTRKVKKYQKVKRTMYNEQGRKAEEWEEMQEYEEEVFYPPDNTAGIFLLKNWGQYSNEPQTIDLRKQEIELRKKQIDSQIW